MLVIDQLFGTEKISAFQSKTKMNKTERQASFAP